MIFAIIEAIAVYGLVLAIVGRYLSDQYLLSALSLILLTLEFPGQRVLDSLLQQIEGRPNEIRASSSTGHEGLNRLGMFNFRFATVPAWSDDAGPIVIV